MDANRDFGQIAREILAEAAETDRREDEPYGSERGDELPEHLRTREGRRKALRKAKERLERERTEAAEASADDEAPVTVALDPREFVTARKAAAPGSARAVARSTPNGSERHARSRRTAAIGSLRPAGAWRKNSTSTTHRTRPMRRGGRAGWRPTGPGGGRPGRSSPREPVPAPTGSINTSDHDSRVMRTQGQPPLQGYN